MVDKLIKEVVNGIPDVSAFGIATEQDWNLIADSENFPCIVFINEFTSNESVSTSGQISNSIFNIRMMFADKIKTLDDKGHNIFEIFHSMSTLAREFMIRLNQKKTLQDGTKIIDNRNNIPFTLDTFEHLFDTDLAGVFLATTLELKLPLDYCKFKC